MFTRRAAQEAETKFVNYANMTIQEQVEIVKKKARWLEMHLPSGRARKYDDSWFSATATIQSMFEVCMLPQQVASVMDKHRASWFGNSEVSHGSSCLDRASGFLAGV